MAKEHLDHDASYAGKFNSETGVEPTIGGWAFVGHGFISLLELRRVWLACTSCSVPKSSRVSISAATTNPRCFVKKL
jgi:hypothetical protein